MMGSSSKLSPVSTTASSITAEEPPSVELRASVLDAAISLGFRNSVMAKWMFEPNANSGEVGTSPSERSNPGLMSPTATSASSHSISNSDESSMSPYSGRFRPSPQSPDRSKHGALGVISEQSIEYTTNMSLEKLPPFSNLTRLGNKPDADIFNASHDPFKKDELDTDAVKTSYEFFTKEKRQQKQAGSGGYDSDGGYLSEGGSGKKSKSKSRWGRKGSENSNGNAHDMDDSDGGNLSEAVATKGRGKSSKKDKTRGKREDAVQRTTEPLSSDNGDPDIFFAKTHASLVHSSSPESSSSSPIATTATLPTSSLSSSMRAHVRRQPDGYTTDSGPSNPRGRSTSAPTKKSKKGQPLAVWDDSDPEKMPAPTQKRSFFRMVSRSISRDREKDKGRKTRDPTTPPPVPPMPTVLPIADRFARSDAGTPLGFASGADAKRSLGEGLNAPALSLAPSPSTPALSIGSSFVDVASQGTRSGSPAELEGGNDSTLAPPPNMITLRHMGSRSSLNYPQIKSAPNGKSMDYPVSAHSLELARGRNGDDGGRSGLGAQGTVDAKGTFLSMGADQPKGVDTKEKMDREKKIRKGLGIFAATGALFGQNKPPPAPASAPAISAPNAHLFANTRPTDTKDIVDALNAKRAGSVGSAGSPGSENVVRAGGASSPSGFSSTTTTTMSPISTPAAGSSSEPESYFPYLSSAAQHLHSSSSLGTSPAGSPASTSKPGTAAESGTIASRRANVPSRGNPLPLVIDVSGEDTTPRKGSVTPTQNRNSTPTIELPPSMDNDDEAELVPPSPRASVYAYYHNMPPPSPPPTGPLPPPPPPGQVLSPSRAHGHATRSPSPLRSLSPTASLGVRNSVLYRSVSPGVQAQANVKRGKEAPFPTRPVLPQQESRDLVERVERTKVMYANGIIDPDAEVGESDWGENDDWRDAEVEDAYVYAAGYDGYEYDGRDETRTSAFIRAARARGEKRVYFASPPPSADPEGVFPEKRIANVEAERIRIDLAPPIEEEDADDADFVQADEALASLNQLRPGARLQKPSEDGDSVDQRSIASASIYSRYSMLDEDSSSQVREGFVKRVHDWEKEDVPDVPKVPDQFKQPDAANANDSPVTNWRAQLKPTNNRFR